MIAIKIIYMCLLNVYVTEYFEFKTSKACIDKLRKNFRDMLVFTSFWKKSQKKDKK